MKQLLVLHRLLHLLGEKCYVLQVMADLTFPSCLIASSVVWGDCTWAFLNSNFFTSLLGAGAGAWAGALAAQSIASRSKQREELLAEIRNTNTALSLTFSICNTLLNLRRDHVEELTNTFYRQKAIVHEAVRRNAPFLDLGPLRMSSFEPPLLPVARLEQLVFEKLSAGTRPSIVMASLIRTVDSLNRTLEERNALLMEIRSMDGPNFNRAKGEVLFAIPTEHGVDNRYSDAIDGLYSRTKDGIFFSKLLGDDLVAHGRKQRGVFQKKFRDLVPAISTMTVPPEAAHLIPPNEDYVGYTSMIVLRPLDVPPTIGARVRRRMIRNRPCIVGRLAFRRVFRWFATPASAPPPG